jgi:hypothetical protein
MLWRRRNRRQREPAVWFGERQARCPERLSHTARGKRAQESVVRADACEIF